jgi:hypothetical protein
MPSVAVRVHHSVSTHPLCRPGPGVQPSGVQPSGVQPSGVQPVLCPVVWLPRPDPAVRPSGVQPVRRPAVWCPSALLHPSRPRQRVVAMGRRRYGGATVTTGRGEFHVVRPVPSGSVDGPSRPGCGQRCGGRVEASGGASAADLGRVVLGQGGCGGPTREARPPQGAPRGWRLRQAGGLAEARRFST